MCLGFFLLEKRVFDKTVVTKLDVFLNGILAYQQQTNINFNY